MRSPFTKFSNPAKPTKGGLVRRNMHDRYDRHPSGPSERILIGWWGFYEGVEGDQ